MRIEIVIFAALCLLCGGVIGFRICDELESRKQSALQDCYIQLYQNVKPKTNYWTVSYKRNCSLLGETCTIVAPTKQLALEEAYRSLTSEIGKNRFALTNIQEFHCEENDKNG